MKITRTTPENNSCRSQEQIMHPDMVTKILAAFYFLCWCPLTPCANECSLLDQLVDMKFQLKDIREGMSNMRKELQALEESRETEQTIYDIQRSLSEVLTKDERRTIQMVSLAELFQNLTGYVTNIWDETQQALNFLEIDLKQNISSLRAIIRQGHLKNNLSLEQLQHSMKRAVIAFKQHVQYSHKATGGSSKSEMKCIGHNYSYMARFNLCYSLRYDTGKTWRDHRDICLSENGDLLTLENSEMLMWLKNLVKNSPKIRSLKAIHIDGSDEGHEGEWRNKNNEPLWTKWATGQPNGFISPDLKYEDAGQHCNSIYTTFNYSMNDIACDHIYDPKNAYICQIEA